ncbi:MAG: 50S ribosomal protein L16 [Candidatus Micrarchaeia archaeon]
MGLRPARTCRSLNKAAWTRYSKKMPRKSFVKALPHNAVSIYAMGQANPAFDSLFRLVAEEGVQVRDNALESARQAANKYLEKTLPGGYFLKVDVYPHNVIRENKMILGAGADRLQKGMRHAYGRPTDRGARVHRGQVIFRLSTTSEKAGHAREALRRAKLKLPGRFSIIAAPAGAA